MRWSLGRSDRRRPDRERTENPDQGGSGQPRAVNPDLGAEHATGDAPDAGWRSLAPLAPSWSSTVPLTAPVQRARPPVLRAPIVPAAGEGAPAPGTVVGLAAVVPVSPVLEPPVRAPLPAYLGDQPPLRHVVARPLVVHTPLTEVTPGSVGEPVAPTPAPPPVAAPTFIPTPAGSRPEPQVVASTEAGVKFREALAALRLRGEPDALPGQSRPEPRTASRPESSASNPPTPAPDPGQSVRPSPSMPHRRATLAQSRRLGLGAPITADDSLASTEPLTHPATPKAPELPAADGATAAPEAPAAAAAPPAAPAPIEVTRPETEQPVIPHPASRADSGADGDTGARARSSRSTRRTDDEPSDAGDDESDGGAPTSTPPRPLAVVRPTSVPTDALTGRAIPLVFRAAARRDVAAPETAVTRAPERAVITRPPTQLAQALQRSHGIDVADVPVRRDAEASTEARRRGARGFTRGGTVYLPDEAPGSAAAATGLLAHELVHAAQQRQRGGSLPPEDSDEGRALEAEAVAAEQMYAQTGRLEVDAPLVHAPAPVTATWVDERIVQHAPVAAAPPQLPPSLEPMRHDIERVADHSARRVMAEWTPPPAPNPQVPVYVPGLAPPAPPGFGTPPTSAPPRVSSRATNPLPSSGQVIDESQREQMYLDMINAEHTRNLEPTVTELTESDRQRMYDLLGQPGTPIGGTALGGRVTGSTTPATPQAPSFTSWTPDRGFVATGPAAAQVAQNMRNAWGGLGGLAPTVAIETTPTDGTGSAGSAMSGATPGTAQSGISAVAGLGSAGRAAAGQPAYDVHGVQLSMADALGNLFGDHHATRVETRHPGAGATGPAAAGAGSAPAGAGVSAQAVASAVDSSDQGPIDLGRIDMDALAIRIYTHLRRRLRQELLVDRERAGLLTDYR